MDNISDIINDVIKKMSSSQPITEDKLGRVWNNVLEENESGHTRLVGIKEGELSIEVDSPAWLYKMKMKRLSILKKLQEDLPEIKEITFRIFNG